MSLPPLVVPASRNANSGGTGAGQGDDCAGQQHARIVPACDAAAVTGLNRTAGDLADLRRSTG
jgi:hypothetical protein